jgi:hypothetical protein
VVQKILLPDKKTNENTEKGKSHLWKPEKLENSWASGRVWDDNIFTGRL